MLPITQDLKKTPRQLVLCPETSTWWEIGTNGESYVTDATPDVYKQCLRAKKPKGLVIVRSVRYEFEIKEPE